MSGNLFIAAALGFVVPVVVSYVKSAKWPKFFRVLTALAVSVGVAVVSLLAQGDLKHFHDVIVNSAVIWATAQAFYAAKFQGTDFNAKLEVGGPLAGGE